jgi:hypothetical protein
MGGHFLLEFVMGTPAAGKKVSTESYPPDDQAVKEDIEICRRVFMTVLDPVKGLHVFIVIRHFVLL